jgi:hypothetical protein
MPQASGSFAGSEQAFRSLNAQVPLTDPIVGLKTVKRSVLPTIFGQTLCVVSGAAVWVRVVCVQWQYQQLL